LFWFSIASTTIEVFPVCLSPIINCLCPRPIGIIVSIIVVPVKNGTFIAFLNIIPFAFLSDFILFVLSFGCPIPSNGFPNGSITRPKTPVPVKTRATSLFFNTTVSWPTIESFPNIATLAKSLWIVMVNPFTYDIFFFIFYTKTYDFTHL